MKIAICDDMSESRKMIENYLTTDFSQYSFGFFHFADGAELIKSYENGDRFDIVFLDVEMSNLNGVEAGKQIRKFDEKAIIILVSSYSKYAVDAFDFEAMNFIVKPYTRQKFGEVFSKALQKYNSVHKYYVISWKNEKTRIAISNIYYIECFKRHLIFRTKDGKYECVGKLSDAAAELIPHGFYQVHQGYIVNFKYIKKFDGADIVLTNGERVMVSVRKRAEVLKAYAHYIEALK